MEDMDRWLQSISDKVGEHEMPEPDGLWDAIEDRLESPEPARRSGVLAWMVRFAAAAACVAVAIISVYYFTGDDMSVKPVIAMTGDEDNIHVDPIEDTVEAEVQSVADVSGPAGAVARYSKEPETITAGMIVSAEETPDCTADDAPVADRVDRRDRNIDQEVFEDGPDCGLLPSRLKRNESRLALSVFTSGALGTSGASSGHIWSYASLRNMVADDYVSSETLVRSRSVNSFDSHNYDMRHHLPVRVGVSAVYYLTRNVAVEAGVSYSHHRSDFSYSDDNMSVTGEQRLDYIGLPLNMQLRIAGWNRFRFYASGGVLFEKLMTGSISGNITDNKGSVTSKRESINEKALQCSLNLSAGAQYDITDVVGVYVEPGVAYHIDNGSTLRNIYKDRPVDFNLNVGLRFSLNRH